MTAPGDPLRVACDATPLIGRPTGVGVFCAGLLGALGRRPDIAATAFAVSWRRRHSIDALVPAGITVCSRPMPARPLQRAWRLGDLPPVEWFVGPADVVHGTNYVVPPTRRAARVSTIYDLTTVRFPELCDGPTRTYPALLRRAIAGGAWVHAPSAFVAEEVVALLGADPARVRAVHPGLPALPPPDTAAARRVLPDGCTRFVLAVGTAEPRKDLPGLVRAWSAVAGDRPDLALVLAGPSGWGSGPLAAALETCPFPRRVTLTGWVDDAVLAGLLAEAAVLAYPSVYEGFGFPPLQAMAIGTPVVATRAGAVPEVVGDAARLVAVGDTDALATALAAVLDDADLAAQLVGAGKVQAGRYSWDRCAAGVAALYHEAAAARR